MDKNTEAFFKTSPSIQNISSLSSQHCVVVSKPAEVGLEAGSSDDPLLSAAVQSGKNNEEVEEEKRVREKKERERAIRGMLLQRQQAAVAQEVYGKPTC